MNNDYGTNSSTFPKGLLISTLFITAIILIVFFLVKFNLVEKAAFVSKVSHDLPTVMLSDFVTTPVHFEENKGQFDQAVRFYSRINGRSIYFNTDEIVLVNSAAQSGKPEKNSTDSFSRLTFRNLNSPSEGEISGLSPLCKITNYFVGNDATQWAKNIKNYGRVKYSQVYPGIDLVFYGNDKGLEFDYIVQPGASPEDIQFELSGAGEIEIDQFGDLHVWFNGSPLTIKSPIVYQITDNGKQIVAGRFIMKNHSTIGFQIDEYDKRFAVVIDPTVLLFSTYLGGSEHDRAMDVEVDATGNVYVLGRTTSENFPEKSSLFTNEGTIVVSKISPEKELLYSTIIGGNAGDIAWGMDLDASGNVYVAGYTSSNDFPTVNAFQDSAGGLPDAFLLKLATAGNALLYSTYFGGGDDEGFAGGDIDVAVDNAGSAYICGVSMPSIGGNRFPTTPNAFQPQIGGYYIQGFVAKFNPNQGGANSLVYCTFLGGEGDAALHSIAVDAGGNAHVTGWTNAQDFPLKNPHQAVRNGKGDMIITKFNADGSDLLFSTYLGGSENGDRGRGIKVDAAGNVLVVGTGTEGFPITSDSFSDRNTGNVVVLLGSSGALTAASYIPLGVYALDLAPDGSLLCAGFGSARLPDGSYISRAALFALAPDLSDTLYTGYVGGSISDIAHGVAAGSDGAVYLVGDTKSTDFPLVNPFQTELKGPADIFIACLLAKQDTIDLIYNQVTMGGPPVFSRRPIIAQHILPQFLINAPDDTLIFRFPGRSTDGTVAFRANNTQIFGLNFPPLNLAAKVFDTAGKEMTPFNLPNIGIGNVAKQFDVTQNGDYLIKVFAESGSPGPLPAPFQVHLSGNVGLPGLRDFPRAIRQDILFNHTAPRPQGIYGKDDGIAQTALFKFVNPAKVSQFANAVIVPYPTSTMGFPPNVAIIRAPDPMNPLSITTPTARTPVCDGLDPTGLVVDFTQIPDPAIPGADAGSVAGTVCAVIGENDASSVTLPLAGGQTILIMDMGSGQEIVDGGGNDFKVYSPAGNYRVAVSNTPFSGSFVSIGDVSSGATSFDLAGSGILSARFVLVEAFPNVTIDAVKALNVFIDGVQQDPASDSQVLVGDVGTATITMRRAKAPEPEFDPFLELIAPNGTRFAQNESGFGDDTSPNLSDAAMVGIDLVQSGFYRFFARGYDQSPGDETSGAFFVRLESGGAFDTEDIIVSSNEEDAVTPQKSGAITQTRQRNSYQFQWHPGQAVNILVNSDDDEFDPVVELYDPEGFLIAANDNYTDRGKSCALQVTLPVNSFNGGVALPDPSTYRLVVSAVDRFSNDDTRPLVEGKAFVRKAGVGSYKVKVFTGQMEGGSGVQPTVAGASPAIVVQGATDVTLAVTGNDFENGATVTFSNRDVIVKQVLYFNSSLLSVIVDVEPDAIPGFRDVIVTNPGGRKSSGVALLEIREELGLVDLRWDAPAANSSHDAPTNLTAQWGAGIMGAPVSLPKSKSSRVRAMQKKNRVSINPGQSSRALAVPNATFAAPVELLNGVSLIDSVGQEGIKEYFIHVSSQQAYSLVITTSNSSGDPDLYARLSLPPDLSTSTFDVSSESEAPLEELIIIDKSFEPFLQDGYWYITVYGFEKSTFTLTAKYYLPEPMVNNSAVLVDLQEFEERRFYIDVPGDATNLTFETSNSSGDPDMYVRFNTAPDLFADEFDFFSENEAPVEERVVVDESTSPSFRSGRWYVSLVGYEAGSVTLKAFHNGSGGGTGEEPTAYNIYRSFTANPYTSGELIGTVPAVETSFADQPYFVQQFNYQVTAVYTDGESTPSNEASALVTRINEPLVSAPDEFQLFQNYPNPFNPTTTIQYAVSIPGQVKITIFDRLGRNIKTLIDGQQSIGQYYVFWDGTNQANRQVAAGVYFYKMQAGDFVQVNKLVLVK